MEAIFNTLKSNMFSNIYDEAYGNITIFPPIEKAGSVCNDVSVLKRLSITASMLQKNIPKYWELVTNFGFQHSAAMKPPTGEVQVLL